MNEIIDAHISGNKVEYSRTRGKAEYLEPGDKLRAEGSDLFEDGAILTFKGTKWSDTEIFVLEFLGGKWKPNREEFIHHFADYETLIPLKWERGTLKDLMARFDKMGHVREVEYSSVENGLLVRATKKGIGLGNIREDFNIRVMDTWIAVNDGDPEMVISVQLVE